MQQLNFLSITATQNVDIKDGASAIFPPLLKDDFSQYIETHLAKNKDVTDSKDKEYTHATVTEHSSSEQVIVEQKTAEPLSETTQNVIINKVSIDEQHLASDEHKVAAHGKDSEYIDEPELLMSFLNKADQTLLEKAPVEKAPVEKAPVEKVTIDKNNLLSTLSGVAKAIITSSETGSESEHTFERDLLLDVSKSSAKQVNESNEIKELITKPIIDTQHLPKATLETDGSAASLNRSENVSSVKSKIELSSVVKAKHSDQTVVEILQTKVEIPQTVKPVDLVKSIDELSLNADNINAKLPTQLGIDTTTKGLNEHLIENQKSTRVVPSNSAANSTAEPPKEALIKQHLTADNKRIEINDTAIASDNDRDNDNQKVMKSLPENQAEVATATVSRSKTQIANERANIPTDQVDMMPNQAKAMMQNDMVSEKTVFTDNSLDTVVNNDKAVTANDSPSLTQQGVSQLGKSQSGISQSSVNQVVSNQHLADQQSTTYLSAEHYDKTKIEHIASVIDVKESEEQMSIKAYDKAVVENTKELTVNNKDIGSKVMPNPLDKAINNFSFSATNASEAANRATQAAYDRIDHQTIEMVSSTSSADISQSQKTNTQLHHETIAIFRKDFSDAVKDKVMLMISQKLQQFDITLDPPELGNMQVRVNLQGEQATVNFVVQNQQAKEALDQNMHKLRDMLAEQGVDVGDANVEQQSQQSDNNETTDKQHRQSFANTAEANDAIEHSLSARRLNSSAQGIDYYA